MEDSAFFNFLLAAFEAMHSIMKRGAAIYVAHADTEGANFRSAFLDAGFKLSGCLVWVKNSLVLGRSDYQWKHEPILYGWKKGESHNWYSGRSETTVIEQSEGEAIKLIAPGQLQINVGGQLAIVTGDNLKMQSVESSVLRFDRPRSNADHPTMKPVELIEYMLSNSTQEGDAVLDPFGGSGSTLIACEKLRRRAFLCELDTSFCDVIIRRWQEFTGGVAELEGDGRSFTEVSKERRDD